MDFSKSVPSSSVCTWFYAFYIVQAVAAMASLLFLIVILFSSKVGFLKTMMSMNALSSLIMFAVAATNSMFFYIICDRALLGGKNTAQV